MDLLQKVVALFEIADQFGNGHVSLRQTDAGNVVELFLSMKGADVFASIMVGTYEFFAMPEVRVMADTVLWDGEESSLSAPFRVDEESWRAGVSADNLWVELHHPHKSPWRRLRRALKTIERHNHK